MFPSVFSWQIPPSTESVFPMRYSLLQIDRGSSSEQHGVLPSYSPRDVLALALAQGNLEQLQMCLVCAAYDPNISVQGLAEVMASLERVGFVDFSSARTTLASSVPRHCARCHKIFRDKDNDPSACVIYHRPTEEDAGATDDANGCPCQSLNATFNHLAKGECYRGWHEDNPRQVDYTSSSAASCDARCYNEWMSGKLSAMCG